MTTTNNDNNKSTRRGWIKTVLGGSVIAVASLAGITQAQGDEPDTAATSDSIESESTDEYDGAITAGEIDCVEITGPIVADDAAESVDQLLPIDVVDDLDAVDADNYDEATILFEEGDEL